MITPPEFVRERLPREAVTTCAAPKRVLGLVVVAEVRTFKKGLLVLAEVPSKGTVVGRLPPPKTTIAVAGGKRVPGGKRWRRVSVVVVRLRVRSS